QRAVDRRRANGAVLHDEDVLSRALADHPVDVQGDSFSEAVAERLHLHELAAEVVAGNLGHRRNGVRGDAGPARDAGVDAVLQRAFAEIDAPRPAGQIDLDGAVERHHPARAVAPENHGTEVAAVETVPLHQLTTRGDELVERVL